MTHYSLEDRIQRRLIVEPPLVMDPALGHIPETARIAALEAEDTANPIAATAVVRKPFDAEPDVAAFQAVFDDLDD